MDAYHISGGKKLQGSCRISGAKNAVLPMLAASLLCRGECMLENVPALTDVQAMLRILSHLGCKSKFENGKININTENVNSVFIPEIMTGTLRSSIFMMGPMLASHGEFHAGYPGGCAIGKRPVDLHLEAMKAFGAEVSEENGIIHCKASKLKGCEINFPFKSVGATENAMMAAALAEGETTIKNAACEPEIKDLAGFMSAMGAHIKGAGTDCIKVLGSRRLHEASYTVMSDRIEAGTMIAAVAGCGGEAVLLGAPCHSMRSIIDTFIKCGCEIKETEDGLYVRSEGINLSAGIVNTEPYPGFPTDMQSQLMSVMTCAAGKTVIKENIFKDRFRIVPYLKDMGADIKIENETAVIKGVSGLQGKRVRAEDLRGGTALVIAGLMAQGNTIVENVCLIDRGYDKLEEIMQKLGAEMHRIKED